MENSTQPVIDGAIRARARSVAARNRALGPSDACETITAAFRAFHRANPGVYVALVAMARDLKRRGHSTYGIGGMFEVLRWHHALATVGDDFKLNNNHRALYAREIMQNEPDLEGFFQLRERIAL